MASSQETQPHKRVSVNIKQSQAVTVTQDSYSQNYESIPGDQVNH